jgi:hypothetical protein
LISHFRPLAWLDLFRRLHELASFESEIAPINVG